MHAWKAATTRVRICLAEDWDEERGGDEAEGGDTGVMMSGVAMAHSARVSSSATRILACV